MHLYQSPSTLNSNLHESQTLTLTHHLTTISQYHTHIVEAVMSTITMLKLLFLNVLLSLSFSVSLNQEGLFLLKAKLHLSDPSNFLSNWNPTDTTPCNWTGVSCHPISAAVTSLHLDNSQLSGHFPTTLCRLPSLTSLSLSNNNLNSSLSTTALSACTSLNHLNLSLNLFSGPIPDTLPNLPHLRLLDLSFNNFSGSIPTTFGNFQHLHSLSLVSNLLTGTIPATLGNISTLQELHLAYNNLLTGTIPASLGNLTNLEDLWLAGCNLAGPIPVSLGNLSRLRNLDLSQNMLTGTLLEALFAELNSIVQIEIYQNSLSGELPRAGIVNLTRLERFDASYNELTGTIPDEFCKLKKLGSLYLDVNQLQGSLPECIAGSESLYELMLFNNTLSGELPNDLGSNSQLEIIDVSYNRFSGEIPASLCWRGALQELLLLYNSFSGGIPMSLGNCTSLTRVRIGNNNLSGVVPDGIWGLPHLRLLELVENSLSGSISNAISGAQNLSILLLSKNQFSGLIPEAIGSLNNLGEFVASHNSLTGSIPVSMTKLNQLGRLVLRDNQLSGEIPQGVGDWKKLNELDLANNRLGGNIPNELGTLPGLNFLDLSGNLLSGEIPIELQNLKLDFLNLSNNQLSGEIPPLYANENYKESFLGNTGLCGDLPGLCPGLGESRNKKYAWILWFIFVLAGIVLITGVAWFYFKFKNFKKMKKGFKISKWRSFHKLGFSEHEIVKLMSEDNVIGSGASGKVYKVVLSNAEVVAVKKLWGATNGIDGFEAEVETLGKIRHKNIVRLWCCCSSGDSKLLVYEYMPNGSLADLLHSSKKNLLDWPTRYKIAFDAAEGLSYLHHDCAPPIVHRDVKSSNILLDGEFGAKVADFGVAKIVRGVNQGAESMSVIAGSYGYIAPEYAYTLRVNEKSDIYSFGVVILELVTGKPPIDPENGEKDLVNWVSSTLEHEAQNHVIDSTLDLKYKEEISKVLSIGLLCTSSIPINRPSMRRVVKMLQEATAVPKSRSGKLAPYYQEDA
ncbi:receptor-like protein kinase HSL1 [Lotus japonicus]|uniref:receptor-like protein kinase HSL1 n=1 Tax=Lotus japonicus TaxID=34305 RepID=UPI00258FF51D|nr:receptor-like protein kinase HSL1 [Lotus japonicus]